MVIFAAFLLSGATAEIASPPVQRVVAERQAVAMVRILPGAQIRFSHLEQTAPESFTDTRVRTAGGSFEPARLIEFQ